MADSIRVLLVDDCEPLCAGLRRAFVRANKRAGGGRYKLLERQEMAPAPLCCWKMRTPTLF